MSYHVLSQAAAEAANLENTPAVVIGPYLLATGQTGLLRVMSVYIKRGESREQLRLLYMNAPALALWREIGKVTCPFVRPKIGRVPGELILVWHSVLWFLVL